MADVEDEDELETDEHGIYREQTEDYSGSDYGLMVDEDGIWQDDTDSYYRGGNDSGFCTAEQKSSSSLNNRCQDGADGEQTFKGNEQVKDQVEYEEEEEEEKEAGEDEEEAEAELGRRDLLTEEHSYNISELEVSRSASVQGSQISCHPDTEDVNSDSRYPELAKGYYTSESELSKQGEGDAGRHEDNEYMAHYREEDPYYTTNDEEYLSERDRFSEREDCSSSGSTKSYKRHHHDSSVSENRQWKSETHQREISRIPGPRSNQTKKSEQNKESFPINDHHAEASNLKHKTEKLQTKRPERLEHKEVVMSRKEQKHETSMSQETEHSLAEFEQLEATLDEISSSDSEDLIGIYLNETEEWELKKKTLPQPENEKHSSSVQNKVSKKDGKRTRKVQDASKRKSSRESLGSARTNGRGSRPQSSSRSERTSRRTAQDGQKLPASRNPMSNSSEKNEFGRSQDTRNLLQMTSEVLTKINQERDKRGHRDSQSAALQGSQIPILRSRSASLTRPGRHWSRSRQTSASPSQSLSSVSSPQPLQKDSQSHNSIFTDEPFMLYRQKSEKPEGSQHSPVQIRRIDSLGSHGNSSPASSRYALSATSLHQVQQLTASAEPSHSGFFSEENKSSNRVASQTIIDDSDDSKTQRSQKPVRLSSHVSRNRKKSSLTANQNSAMSRTNIDRQRSLYLTQSKSMPHLQTTRSNSVGAHNRLQQPLKAMPGFMKSSVPDAIGGISLRMAGINGTEAEAMVNFKEMYMVESQQHRVTEETYKQLQVDYLDLLKQYAETKNAVDSLRLGAEVRLISSVPPPVSIETGTFPPAKHANIFTLSKMSTPSLGHIQRGVRVAEASTVTSPQQATLSEVPQDDGSHAMQSVQSLELQKRNESTATSPATKTHADAAAETSVSVADDDVLSLSGRIRAAEDQIKEFQRRSREDSVDEKIQFLQSIRGAYAELEDEFDNDFVQKDGIYSSASRAKRTEIESKLVQLHLTIGQLEDDVEATQKSNDASHIKVERDSAQNLILLASSVKDEAWNAAQSDTESQSFLPSVASINGNYDADERLQDFNKTYTDLMDQYRRLKQMKSSPKKDDDVADTLTKLKKVYEQIPEHRKPALPAELENQYNAVKGSFIDRNSEHEEKKQKSLNAYASLQEFSTSAETSTVMNDSDLSSGSKLDSVKHSHTSKRHSNELSSASQSSVSGSSQLSAYQNRILPTNKTKDAISSSSREKSLPHERLRHGSRRLPKMAAKAQSQSQAGSIPDEIGSGYKQSSGRRSMHHKPLLQSNPQTSALTRMPGSQTKMEQKLIRTSAHTPPGQSYSDTESDATDDTVEEIFKQKQKRDQDQSENIDGFRLPKTKDGSKNNASVGSSACELEASVSVTEEEISLLATKRSDKRREDSAESAHLQKFTEAQQRQMQQPIPLHPTAVNPSAAFFVPPLQSLQNPYFQSIQQPGLQQLTLQQPGIHQLYVPVGTAPAGTVPAGTVQAGGIIPAHIVTDNQGVSENYFARNGHFLQTREPRPFMGNGYGQITSMAHPEVNYNVYQLNPYNVNDYIDTDRHHHRMLREEPRNGGEDRHRLHRERRFGNSPHRNRTSRKRFGSRSLDDPLPSFYFEPTAHEAYPYHFAGAEGLAHQRPAFAPSELRPSEAGIYPTQYVDPYSFMNTNNPYSNGVGTGVDGVGTGVGAGSGLPTIYESPGITSRGIQNVPLMSTTGVQYMVENGLNRPYGGDAVNMQHGTGNQTVAVGLIGQSTTGQPLVVTGASCPLCGRVDYHSHTESNLQPRNGMGYVPAASGTQMGMAPVLTQRGQTLVKLPNKQTSVAFVGDSSNTVGLPYATSAAFPSTMAGSSRAIPVPRHTVPTNSPSKVRYYVQEYGGQNTEDEEANIRRRRRPKHKIKSSDYHVSTDDDDDGDIDWALLKVVSTAKSLKKRSEDMTTSLHDDLLVSYRDSTILQCF